MRAGGRVLAIFLVQQLWSLDVGQGEIKRRLKVQQQVCRQKYGQARQDVSTAWKLGCWCCCGLSAGV